LLCGQVRRDVDALFRLVAHGLFAGDVLHQLPGGFLVLAVGRHNIAQTAHVGLVVHSHGGHLDQLDIAVCRQRAVLQHAGLPGADEDDGRLAGDEEVGALGLRQHGVGSHLLIVHQVHYLLDGVLGLRQGDAACLAVIAEVVAAVLIQEVHPGRLGVQLHDDGVLAASGGRDGVPQLGGDVPHVVPGPALLGQLHTVAVKQLGVQGHRHSVQPLGQGVLLAVHIVGVHTPFGIDAHIKALALNVAVQRLQNPGVHIFLDVSVHPEHIRGLIGLQRGIQLGPVGVPGDLLD
ncbi:tRNA pseudouridine(55) synthase TruB, partial [Dysosmobacter welbionis]